MRWSQLIFYMCYFYHKVYINLICLIHWWMADRVAKWLFIRHIVLLLHCCAHPISLLSLSERMNVCVCWFSRISPHHMHPNTSSPATRPYLLMHIYTKPFFHIVNQNTLINISMNRRKNTINGDWLIWWLVMGWHRIQSLACRTHHDGHLIAMRISYMYGN